MAFSLNLKIPSAGATFCLLIPFLLLVILMCLVFTLVIDGVLYMLPLSELWHENGCSKVTCQLEQCFKNVRRRRRVRLREEGSVYRLCSKFLGCKMMDVFENMLGSSKYTM